MRIEFRSEFRRKSTARPDANDARFVEINICATRRLRSAVARR
jgi:hypothetical protein